MEDVLLKNKENNKLVKKKSRYLNEFACKSSDRTATGMFSKLATVPNCHLI